MSADGTAYDVDELKKLRKDETLGTTDPRHPSRAREGLGGAHGEARGRLSSTRVRLGIAVAALAFYAIFIFRTSFVIEGTRYFVLFEDAMISMRYARHLADGHGLVWNIGEAPIEGFTNLLWVLWMSVAHKLGLAESKISLFIMLTGVGILLTTGMLAAKIARKVTSAPWVPTAVLAATLFCYPLVFWTLRGMEVGALTVIVYALVWLVLENEDQFSLPRTLAMGVLTSMAILVRSDSVVPVGLISLYGFLTCSQRWLFAGVIGVFAGGAAGGQIVHRRAYFHDTLPNTAHLKLGNIHLSDRLPRGVFVALQVLTMHLALPIAIIAGSLRGKPAVATLVNIWRDRQDRRLVLLGAIFTMQIVYATFVGGDAWEWMLYANRYMSVGMPALVIIVAVMLQRAIANNPERRAEFARNASYALVACGGLLVLLMVAAKLHPEQGIAATIVFSKTPFAVGGAFVLAGLLLRLQDARTGIVEGLAWLQRRLASQRTVSVTALLLTAIVWAPSHLLPLGRWAAQNAAQYADEARYTRLGLLIQSTTAPDFRIAVAAAGATPYFAQRPTEDLLGKNDSHIAHLKPRGVFSPGHDKWDYQYSLGQKQSMLVVEPVDLNEADKGYMDSLGFEEMPNGMFLRKDAPVARREVLGEDVPDGATLATALASVSRTLPPPMGVVDLATILAFGAVALLVVRRISKDDETYAELSPELPVGPTELDEGQKRALEGAKARSIPTLDGMRGIAVIAVLMFHFAWTFPGDDPSAAHGLVEKLAVQLHAFMWTGWTGVDLFFVLSGYLITRGLVTDSEKPLGTRMKSFWMRRVLRIFPLYYAVLIVGTAVTLALGARWIPGIPYWIYMQNYTLAFDREVMRWTAHFWSLAIEEQFYFVWPIVALTVSRKKLIPLTLGLVVLTVGLRGFLTFKGANIPLFQGWYGDEPGGLEHGIAKFVYRATFTRADGLLLGAFVAVTQREVTHPVSQVWRRLRKPILIGTALALLGLYVLATGLNDYDRRVIGVGYVTLALFFASAVSFCGDQLVGPRMQAFLNWRPLVSCGKVSYGMYIFHWPLVVVGVPVLERMQHGQPIATQMAMSLSFVIGGIAAMWVLASVSFRFFETPFLKLKGKFHD